MTFRDDWFSDFDVIHRQMDRLLDHLAGSKPPLVRFCSAAWEPPIDVYETDNEIVVLIELAGVKQSDIELMIDQDILTVRGERQKVVPIGGKRAYYLMEIGSGYFCRRIRLPVPVDGANVKATYESGFVEVVLPKARAKHVESMKIHLTN
ncbi:MAG: Hsp20/alpha crystallin family protein [Dehalococcoidia bacterium]|nr:Hsp20/alpha crystallin family protein [Dehalococcoidia bacterium]